MKIPDNLLCLFSARLEERNGSYVVEVPEREITAGTVRPNERYRVAVLAVGPAATTERTSERDRADSEPPAEAGARSPEPRGRDPQLDSGPPVEEGDRRTVEIEDIGEQGDGIARVERGYVVIVPDTEKGERVTIEITDVKANVGFGDVVERKDYYE